MCVASLLRSDGGCFVCVAEGGAEAKSATRPCLNFVVARWFRTLALNVTVPFPSGGVLGVSFSSILKSSSLVNRSNVHF